MIGRSFGRVGPTHYESALARIEMAEAAEREGNPVAAKEHYTRALGHAGQSEGRGKYALCQRINAAIARLEQTTNKEQSP